jgi:hypothetical protein
VREACARRADTPTHPLTLLEVLKAYDFVLRSHGLSPQDDTMFYRVLLKLNQLRGPWHLRLEAVEEVRIQ